MNYAERIQEAFDKVDSILAEAIANGDARRGYYGCIIGDTFVGNDGSVLHHVNSPAVVKYLRGERVRELEQQISYYREQLSKAEDSLAAINQTPQ